MPFLLGFQTPEMLRKIVLNHPSFALISLVKRFLRLNLAVDVETTNQLPNHSPQEILRKQLSTPDSVSDLRLVMVRGLTGRWASV